MKIDLANILFSGRCNLRCPDCIGRALSGGDALPANLERFPLLNLERFIDALREGDVRQITLSGTNTDPQLHRHEGRLLDHLRRRLPGVAISLHTNGLLALKKIDTFNRYDRATISLPSFDPATCQAMTGSPRVLDLARILSAATIPIKISTLVTRHNHGQLRAIIDRCGDLGIRRLALRKVHGPTAPDNPAPSLPGSPVRTFAGNPVYMVNGVEVTVWDFSRVELRCLNLLSDGSISDRYELIPPASAGRGVKAAGPARPRAAGSNHGGETWQATTASP